MNGIHRANSASEIDKVAEIVYDDYLDGEHINYDGINHILDIGMEYLCMDGRRKRVGTVDVPLVRSHLRIYHVTDYWMTDPDGVSCGELERVSVNEKEDHITIKTSTRLTVHVHVNGIRLEVDVTDIIVGYQRVTYLLGLEIFGKRIRAS